MPHDSTLFNALFGTKRNVKFHGGSHLDNVLPNHVSGHLPHFATSRDESVQTSSSGIREAVCENCRDTTSPWQWRYTCRNTCFPASDYAQTRWETSKFHLTSKLRRCAEQPAAGWAACLGCYLDSSLPREIFGDKSVIQQKRAQAAVLSNMTRRKTKNDARPG